jgi:hypothetical protein
MGEVVTLNQEVLGACVHCSSTEFQLVLDQVNYTKLMAVRCSSCKQNLICNWEIENGYECKTNPKGHLRLVDEEQGNDV